MPYQTTTPITPRRSARLAAKQGPSQSNTAIATPSPPRRHSRRIDKRDSLALLPTSPRTNAKSNVAVTPDSRGRCKTRKFRRMTIDPSRMTLPSSTVQFGENIEATYNTCDPPNRFQLIPSDTRLETIATVEPELVVDDITKRNEAILAEWDNFSESSSDTSSSESDSEDDFVGGKCKRVVVKETEIDHLSPTSFASRHRGKREHPVFKREIVFCEHCSRGVVRTTEIFYN